MNKDLTGDSAVWRVLQRSQLLTACRLLCRLLVKEAPKMVLRRMMGPSLGDGHSSRCCTLGELSHHCDCLSVIASQEKCDEQEAVIATRYTRSQSETWLRKGKNHPGSKSAMCLRFTIGSWLFMAAPPGCVTEAFWSQLLHVPASTIPMPKLRTLSKWLLCIQPVL